jgi:hypothetical protein
MLKRILDYIRAWSRGEDAELHIDETLHVSWWEVGAIAIIIGLVLFIICK